MTFDIHLAYKSLNIPARESSLIVLRLAVLQQELSNAQSVAVYSNHSKVLDKIALFQGHTQFFMRLI